MDELKELFAAQNHKDWSKWMTYLFSVCIDNGSGYVRIPRGSFRRWKRQIDTDYKDLSEEEKGSNRRRAEKSLDIINNNMGIILFGEEHAK